MSENVLLHAQDLMEVLRSAKDELQSLGQIAGPFSALEKLTHTIACVESLAGRETEFPWFEFGAVSGAAREAIKYLSDVIPLLSNVGDPSDEAEGEGVYAVIAMLEGAVALWPKSAVQGRFDEVTRRAFRAVFASLDGKLGAELKGDVLHKGSVLATLMMIRDTVATLDPELSAGLDFPQAEGRAS